MIELIFLIKELSNGDFIDAVATTAGIEDVPRLGIFGLSG